MEALGRPRFFLGASVATESALGVVGEVVDLLGRPRFLGTSVAVGSVTESGVTLLVGRTAREALAALGAALGLAADILARRGIFLGASFAVETIVAATVAAGSRDEALGVPVFGS